MALDCNVLRMLAFELDEKLRGGRIDKIYQMSKTQVLMTVRSLGAGYRLYASCDAAKGRVCLTDMKFENPDVPPVFCMLLRKHLAGGRIVGIEAVRNERVIKINVENTNELMESTYRRLIVEIMGKHSNIILTDEENRIIDCVSRVDFTVSEKRQVLPGLYYKEPPKSEKNNPYETDDVELLNIFTQNSLTDQSLMDNFCGMSPMMAREIAFASDNNPIDGVRIFKSFYKRIESCDIKPTLLIDKKTRELKDVYIFDIEQYGEYYEKKYFDSINECVDFFFSNKESKRKIDEKRAEIHQIISKSVLKVSKKLDIHLKNIEKAKKKDRYRIYAELITANLYKLTENAKEAEVENYYDENKLIKIPLDETISPAKNAKKYFEKYNKEKNMEKVSRQMAKELADEIIYLEEVRDMSNICDDVKSLSEVKEELEIMGYVKSESDKKNKKKKSLPSKPLEFVSSEGFVILCGRNNKQNDELTLKCASKNDIWLHIRNAPGSHTVIRCDGQDVGDKTLEEAAIIAAYYSKKSNDTKADVDYTRVKYVKKPATAKPGMVIYDKFKGITVEPDIKIVDALRK